MITELMVYRCRCSKCPHAWTTKTHDVPAKCPQCKRVTWNDDNIAELTIIPAVDPEPVVSPVFRSEQVKQETLAALRAMTSGASAQTIAEPVTVEPVEDEWIYDPNTFENGDILYWRHKPRQKPVVYKRETDYSGA